MTALHNHNRRTAPSNPMVSVGLVGAVLEGGSDCSEGYWVCRVAVGVEKVMTSEILRFSYYLLMLYIIDATSSKIENTIYNTRNHPCCFL